MPILIKNCGLKTVEALAAAASHGASFAGFVHHEASPRHVSLPQMQALQASAPPALRRVAVLVSPADTLLDALMHIAAPDYVQVHGVHAPARIAEIAARTQRPVIAAIAVASAADLQAAPALEAVSAHLLFDAKSPGSGQPFDWDLLRDYHKTARKPWFLSGGLSAANVAQAIAATAAPMVDVSSGIEEPPGSGNKSLEKIAAFNKAGYTK